MQSNEPLLDKCIDRFIWWSAKQALLQAKEQGAYKEITLSDAAVVMSYAKKVMIVPGYGLAVAQAQHACHELEKLLEEKGVKLNMLFILLQAVCPDI